MIDPCEDYQKSYFAYIKELDGIGERPKPWVLSWQADPFQLLLDRLQKESIEENLSKELVPHKSYWLIEKDEILAVSNLRLRLNERLLRYGGHIGLGVRPTQRGKGLSKVILKLTLDRAREHDIQKVMMSCDKENLASAAMIKSCGGVLENEIYVEEINETVQRYWIKND